MFFVRCLVRGWLEIFFILYLIRWGVVGRNGEQWHISKVKW